MNAGCGFGQAELKFRGDVIFAVRNASIDYILPAHLDDSLVVLVAVLVCGCAT